MALWCHLNASHTTPHTHTEESSRISVLKRSGLYLKVLGDAEDSWGKPKATTYYISTCVCCGLVHFTFLSLCQCPPCRSLTRVLVESYRTIKESGQKFEIVFVSADRYSRPASVFFSAFPETKINMFGASWSPAGRRSPFSSTSVRCRGWQCPIQMRLGDHDSTDFTEYKVSWGHCLRQRFKQRVFGWTHLCGFP